MPVRTTGLNSYVEPNEDFSEIVEVGGKTTTAESAEEDARLHALVIYLEDDSDPGMVVGTISIENRPSGVQMRLTRDDVEVPTRIFEWGSGGFHEVPEES